MNVPTVNKRASSRRLTGLSFTGTRRGLILRDSLTSIDSSCDNVSSKRPLLAEFRAHEEDCAVRILQHAIRGYLAHRYVLKLLLQVYEKQYDPIIKKYFYINTFTKETTWERPRLLDRFLPPGMDIRKRQIILSPLEACQRIQRLIRFYLAKQRLRLMICENYMKLFDAGTKTYYYLNTRTGDTSETCPPFLIHDLEVEMFYFRRAVCKVSTTSNLYGSGILGRFHHLLCLLTDGKTLENSDMAQNAHVWCNYIEGSASFNVFLQPEILFVPFMIETASFVLCAVDEEQFIAFARDNVHPLVFTLNDRKMGCVDQSMRLQDPIEVVGYPQGKSQITHPCRLTRMIPHSISPIKMQFTFAMEMECAGSAVFTRGGKLLGLLPFTTLKQGPPTEFYYIKPMLETITTLVTPYEPILLSTSIASDEVHVYWHIPRQHLHGLELDYELEISQHRHKQVKEQTDFTCVYVGKAHHYRIGELQSDTMYSIRCRSMNPVMKSPWSAVLRLITTSKPSLAWRVRYCTSIQDAIKRIQRCGETRRNGYNGGLDGERGDPMVHNKCLEWILSCLENSEQDLRPFEQELVTCNGLHVLFEAATRWFPTHHQSILLTSQILILLVQLQGPTQQFMTVKNRLEVVVRWLREYATAVMLEPKKLSFPSFQDPKQAEDEENVEQIMSRTPSSPHNMDIVLASVSLLGHILNLNGSAKQLCHVTGAIALILHLLQDPILFNHTDFLTECCFVLGRYSHDHSLKGRFHVVESQGIATLAKIMSNNETNPKILYWSLVTLGNLAYGSDTTTHEVIQAHGNAVGLIDIITHVKMLYLVRLSQLEIEKIAKEKQCAHLQANLMGEHMRNELDTVEHEVLILDQVILEFKDHHVGQAADFALHYVLTQDQLRVMNASKQLIRNVLLRKLAISYGKWCEVTIYERHRGIVIRMLTTLKHRQLSAGFRRWESVVRTLRRQSILPGTGLALDLNKKTKERYRMLVLQK